LSDLQKLNIFGQSKQENSLKLFYELISLNEYIVFATQKVKFEELVRNKACQDSDHTGIAVDRVEASDEEALGIVDKGNGRSLFSQIME
jgi:hypothetical protein